MPGKVGMGMVTWGHVTERQAPKLGSCLGLSPAIPITCPTGVLHTRLA